ncbi:hypothetical protein AS850_04540 [Frondihabitans sp. 762G35]|uniref:hypothetical protein n=1 Tax=Frondihabitans sp. 762G35 TaxID=1446794 RepID=UPI000D22057D|nr:hypothetical protein [Frondihabitans sp. 762G35]ARC56343.1 hypothetical protein AS850_04540 [Frondihabitans sp. 762G35]
MSSHPPAYAVPFVIDRSLAPRLYRLVNMGDEVVRGLRVTLLGSGLLVPVSATCLAPGSRLTLTIVGSDLSRDSIVVVRWFRPDGDEYLWRFSF